MQEVIEVFFSSNEKFALILTKYQASLVQIHSTDIEMIAKIDLPKSETKKDKWLAAINNTGTKVILHSTSDF